MNQPIELILNRGQIIDNLLDFCYTQKLTNLLFILKFEYKILLIVQNQFELYNF